MNIERAKHLLLQAMMELQGGDHENWPKGRGFDHTTIDERIKEANPSPSFDPDFAERARRGELGPDGPAEPAGALAPGVLVDSASPAK